MALRIFYVPGQNYRMQNLLLILGAIIIAVGLLWPIINKLAFGKLPLDLSTKIGNVQVVFPLGTRILLSVLISIIFSFCDEGDTM